MTPDDASLDRREFLKTASATGAGLVMTGRLAAPSLLAAESPNEKVVVAVFGLNGRGMVHAQNFAKIENSEVAYICDVDATVLAKAAKEVSGSSAKVPKAPKAIDDFRRAL